MLTAAPSPPASAADFVGQLQQEIGKVGGGKTVIGSLTGRYFSMDRDKRWERNKLAWDAIVLGRGEALEGIAQHIKKFWEPRMRRELLSSLDSGGATELSATVSEAIAKHRSVLN